MKKAQTTKNTELMLVSASRSIQANGTGDIVT